MVKFLAGVFLDFSLATAKLRVGPSTSPDLIIDARFRDHDIRKPHLYNHLQFYPALTTSARRGHVLGPSAAAVAFFHSRMV
ncbi:hypothetical protein TWF694_001912 [Orbilia ellipsospora]|uniref:Secreted protein n=1 Tax=Orbilia ellipsospora TaxID=2528407 RepID=A0AAV9X6W4_9PEZI